MDFIDELERLPDEELLKVGLFDCDCEMHAPHESANCRTNVNDNETTETRVTYLMAGWRDIS